MVRALVDSEGPHEDGFDEPPVLAINFRMVSLCFTTHDIPLGSLLVHLSESSSYKHTKHRATGSLTAFHTG